MNESQLNALREAAADGVACDGLAVSKEEGGYRFETPEMTRTGLSESDFDALAVENPWFVSNWWFWNEIEGTTATQFPFAANGRALTTERDDGFLRVVWRESDHAVLGLQAVGAGVSELSAGFALAIEMGARLEDLAATICAHPTQSETIQEACLKALGRALHT